MYGVSPGWFWFSNYMYAARGTLPTGGSDLFPYPNLFHRYCSALLAFHISRIFYQIQFFVKSIYRINLKCIHLRYDVRCGKWTKGTHPFHSSQSEQWYTYLPVDTPYITHVSHVIACQYGVCMWVCECVSMCISTMTIDSTRLFAFIFRRNIRLSYTNTKSIYSEIPTILKYIYIGRVQYTETDYIHTRSHTHTK